jgi:uncharacterized protein (TIGR02996 family)
VTTEEDFQKALDANPEDHQTRLVFADWLQERDDPRAEGYRALGTCQLYPDMNYGMRFVYQSSPDWKPFSHTDRSVLPPDWYAPLLNGELALVSDESRRAAEDKAALAFAKLPARRRSKLLSARPV